MKSFPAIVFVFIAFAASGQMQTWDSLRREYRLASTEELKIDILNQLAANYSKISIDKAEEVALEALDRANAIRYQKGIGDSYNTLAVGYSIKGVYDKGLEFFLKALAVREKEKDNGGAAKVMSNLAGVFMYQGNYNKALEYSRKSLQMVQGQGNKLVYANGLLAHGVIYENMKDTSKALSYIRQSLGLFRELNQKEKMGSAYIEISEVLQTMDKPQLALENCFRAMDLLDVNGDQGRVLLEVLGQIYSDLGNDKTALHYLHQARELADHYKSVQGELRSRLKLSELFEKKKQFDSALYYRKEYGRINEETFSNEMASRLAFLTKVYETENQDHQLELREQKIAAQNRVIISISVVVVLLSITGLILYSYYREKRNANVQLSDLNKLISERNEEITVQSEELIEANKEIKRINESLEDEVNFRTDKIRIQNEKLIEYAYFNAHKVRGPLARILGLSLLVENPMSLEETKDLNKKIQFSALELDEVIKAINKRLETDPE